MKRFFLTGIVLFMICAIPAFANEFITMEIETSTYEERAAIANSGAAIQYVHPTEGWIVADVPTHRIKDIETLGFAMTSRKEDDSFPNGYHEYHDYAEQVAELTELNQTYPDISELFSIGQSHEGKELYCLKISDNPQQDESEEGAGLVVALHHAREILTPEVALYTARQLLEAYDVDEMIASFIDNREIYIIPNLNPDGGEYDHLGGRFKLWRKNRSDNDGALCKGVDLNRNYGYEWGGAGSTNFKCDLTYRGSEAFSEPETKALRDFVILHSNIHTIVSLHTYSELILYPWGYKRDPIDNFLDKVTFSTLANYMADQNGYTPQQASDLYPTSGDTTDWAYGELGIFAFTFELSPASPLGGAFYPSPEIFGRALPDNYAALLLAIGMARDPYLILSTDLWKLNAEKTVDDSIEISWASIIETEAAGWNVLRSTVENGLYEKINESVIEPDQPEYVFIDETTLESGMTFYYKVEFLSNEENNQIFGPVSVSQPDTDDDDDDDTSSDDDAEEPDDDDTAEDNDDEGRNESCCAG